MKRPKGKLFALLTFFVAIGLIAATGAFSTVTADRTVSVNVAGDDSALLQLQSNSSANGDYATLSGSTVEINLDSSAGISGSGQGINDNATTDIFKIVTVTNQGSQTVELGGAVTNGTNVDIYATAIDDGQRKNLTTGETVTLTVGETESVGLTLVANDAGSGSFDSTFTLNAS